MSKKNIRKKLSILVSNDDGIDALGILALVHEMKKIGTVTVVAPDKQQSAVGHAITMNYPLRVKEFYKNGSFFGYAVQGTPADAVKPPDEANAKTTGMASETKFRVLNRIPP